LKKAVDKAKEGAKKDGDKAAKEAAIANAKTDATNAALAKVKPAKAATPAA